MNNKWIGRQTSDQDGSDDQSLQLAAAAAVPAEHDLSLSEWRVVMWTGLKIVINDGGGTE